MHPQWIVADLLDYQAELRLYDLVIVFYLQIPPRQRTIVLRGAADAVGAGGTLLVVAHDSANLTDGYGGPRHAEVLYTAPDVVADLASSGLLIERADRVERLVTTDAGDRVALDALVRARRD